MLSPATPASVSRQRRMQLVSAPTAEPLSIPEGKTALRIVVSSTNPDALNKIATARQIVEGYTGLALVQQTWDMYLDGLGNAWPVGFNSLSTRSGVSTFNEPAIDLFRPPLISVGGVYVTDDEGTETTVDPSIYWVSRSSANPRIALRLGQTWPYHRSFEGFRVRQTNGFLIPFTYVDATLTAPGHGLVNGTIKRVSNAGGSLPSELAANTDYYVVGATSNTLGLSATLGGSPITFTGAVSGQDFLGELPTGIRRALIMLSALDLSPSGQGGSVDTPIAVADILRQFKDMRNF